MDCIRHALLAVAILLSAIAAARGGITEYTLDLSISTSRDTNVVFSRDAATWGNTPLVFNLDTGDVVVPSIEEGFRSPFTQLEGGLTLSNHDVGVRFAIDTTDSIDETVTSLTFGWRSSDSFNLVANTPTATLPNLSLKMNWTAHLTATADFADLKFGGNPLDFEVFTGVSVESLSLSNDFLRLGQTHTINTDIGVTVATPGSRSGRFSVEFRSSFFFGGGNRVEIDGSKTFTLTSITFEDGSTPEQHGFDIMFESGRTSPNLATPPAVPEPSTLTIFAISGALIAGYSIRRRMLSHQDT